MFRMSFEYRILVLFFLVSIGLCGQCPNMKTDIRSIRKRRYVAFPDGSDVVLTADFAKTFMTHVPSGWYVTMDLDVIFPLPDKAFAEAFRRKQYHRQKREFWERLRGALDLHNMDGYACVLQAICEAQTHLAPPGKSLVHDLLRAVFSAPLHEKEFVEEIGELMHKDLTDPDFCEQVDRCHFSILNFVLDFNKRKK